MKKLLSILAAVGLSATTGTAVVACGTNDNDSKPKVKEITEFLIEAKLKLGEFNEAAEAKKQAQIVINEIPELVGKVNLDDPDGGKIHVSVKKGETSLTGTADFSYSLKPPLVRDIKDFLPKEMNLGEFNDDAAAEAKAKTVVDGIFELKGKLDLVLKKEERKIHLSVKDEFKNALTGEADFSYSLKPPLVRDIKDFLPKEMNLGEFNDDAAAEAKAKTVVDGIFELKGKLDLVLKKEERKIHLSVKDEFKNALTGEADFSYSLKPPLVRDIKDFLPKEMNLGEFNDDAAAEAKAKTVVDGIFELKGKLDLVLKKEERKIHLSVKDEFKNALTGEADFSYSLKPPLVRDIKDFLPKEMNLGEFNDDAAAEAKAKTVVDGIFELKGKLDLVLKKEERKIHLSVKDEFKNALTGEADFSYSLKPPLVRDIKDFLPKEMNLGEFNDDAAAEAKAKTVVDGISELKGRLDLVLKKEERKIRLSVKDEFKNVLTGEADFTYSLNRDSQDIINTINSTLFTKSVSVNSSAEEVKIGVGAKFIKDRLTEEFSNLFIDDLFSLKSIMNDQGAELSDNDLKVVGLIQTTIGYSYGSFENESANLLITIKEIKKTPKRDNELKILADDLNRDEFSGNWYNYFYTLKRDMDLNSFSFEFSEGNLRENRIAQNIIYDEIQLILRADFKANNIDITKRYFNPDTVQVTYKKFELNGKDKKITVASMVAIDVKDRADGEYHPAVMFFDYTLNYSLVK